MKKRIAFFGPLDPIRSGISDYDEELLSLLNKDYEIDVFTGSTIERGNVYHHGEFYLRNKQKPYDLPIYQMGNALLHEYMYGAAFQNPGAVVFHDYCLHHSRAKMLLLKALYEEYADEAKANHPEHPDLWKMLYGGVCGDLLLYYFPFVKLLLRSALAAGAHTNFTVDQLRQAEQTPVIKIPMAVLNDPAVSTDLYPGKCVIASFGLVTREKRIEPVLQALAELHWYYPNLVYVIAGEVASHYDLKSQIERFGLSKIVEITGYLDRTAFHRYLNRADIVINLRYPSAREMSATLLRALAYGKTVLMSRLQHLMEIPEEAAIRIRPDHELEDVFHHLWQLIENESLRRRKGEAAAKYIRENHSPEQMRSSYRELIETALERKQTFRVPELPLHLRSYREIMREYVRKSVFAGSDSNLLEWIV